jgi:probable phosphoglycerate mutase
MKVYLIRHGQTDYNLNGIVQGSGVDTSLNEEGKKQAELFYKAYGNINFDRVYTSKLLRSIQSVQKFIEKPTPWVALQELNEISWGNSDGMKISSHHHIEYLNVIKQWASGKLDVALPGGETPLEVYERQKKVKAMLDNEKNGSNILISMHGRAMRIFLCLLTQIPLKNMDNFEHDNLCLYVLERKNSDYIITVNNDRSHLMC